MSDSKLFDYMLNGGDELAAAQATIEHMGGCLGREIELNKELRDLNADMLAALKRAEEWLSGWASAEPYIDVIRAAIAKAEGKQP